MKKLIFLLFTFLIAGMQLIQAQGVVVTGKVTDGTTGDPLPGVTIQVKGTTVGQFSDADGAYRLSVPAGATTLVFSSVGYQTQEIEIAGQSVIDVALQQETIGIDEIVVTGYVSEKKKDIIGSVAVVNTDEMLSTPAGNVTAQIAGRVAGITTSSDGSLGGSAKVRVRGFGSFTGSEPLYIIDGVPSESVERLNPNDIESMQVLKDAASASVYGSRAANGVIIITTRQGQEGPIKVNLDAFYGINYVSKNNFPELLNAAELGELRLQSQLNAGYDPMAPTGPYGDAQYFLKGETEVTVPEYSLAGTSEPLLAGTVPACCSGWSNPTWGPPRTCTWCRYR